MLGQVVTAGEALGAQGTGEPLLARVRPVVAGQLIRTGKLLVTARPVTGKGPLTWTKKKQKTEWLEGKDPPAESALINPPSLGNLDEHGFLASM